MADSMNSNFLVIVQYLMFIFYDWISKNVKLI
jgi:hypothetical protein